MLLENSLEITCYPVYPLKWVPFQGVGFTIILPRDGKAMKVLMSCG
jgi:hypothetical protein